MPEMMRDSDARTHLNTVQVRMTKARTNPNPVDTAGLAEARAQGLGLIDEAQRRAGLSRKALALTAQTQESQLSEAMNGRARFDVAWLFAQDDAFWQEFWPLVAAAKQLTPENRASVRRARLLELLGLLLEEVA